jgi:hypothetical protein
MEASGDMQWEKSSGMAVSTGPRGIPGVVPKCGPHPVTDTDNRDAVVKGEQKTETRPVGDGEHDT